MKTIKFGVVLLILATLIVSCCPSAKAQTADNTTANVATATNNTIPMTYGIATDVYNSLSVNSQNEIKTAYEKANAVSNVTNNLQNMSKWAGMGKEIGEGVKGALTAVKDVSIELSNSNLGKVTLGLVVWYVVGKDAVRIAIGFFIVILGITFLTISYFRTFKRKIVIEKSGPFWNRTKKYQELSSSQFWEYPNVAAVMHFIFLIIILAAAGLIMFA